MYICLLLILRQGETGAPYFLYLKEFLETNNWVEKQINNLYFSPNSQQMMSMRSKGVS